MIRGSFLTMLNKVCIIDGATLPIFCPHPSGIQGSRITDETVLRQPLHRYAERSRSLDYVSTSIRCYRGRLASPRWTDFDPGACSFTALSRPALKPCALRQLHDPMHCHSRYIKNSKSCDAGSARSILHTGIRRCLVRRPDRDEGSALVEGERVSSS